MAETITYVGSPVQVGYGDVALEGERREIPGCVVSLQGQAEVDGPGVWDGDHTILQVLAPAGTSLYEGDVVEIRGVRYTVKHVPFDWSMGRRALHPRHRPRTQFLVERGEA